MIWSLFANWTLGNMEVLQLICAVEKSYILKSHVRFSSICFFSNKAALLLIENQDKHNKLLTGTPGGPAGPLLSCVQVQALGKAGQSTSFLWMMKMPCKWQRKKKLNVMTKGFKYDKSKQSKCLTLNMN